MLTTYQVTAFASETVLTYHTLEEALRVRLLKGGATRVMETVASEKDPHPHTYIHIYVHYPFSPPSQIYKCLDTRTLTIGGKQIIK